MAIRHPEGTAAFSSGCGLTVLAGCSGVCAFISCGLGYLAYRACAGIPGGIPPALIRICCASVAFILVCEYALRRRREADDDNKQLS